MLLGWQSLWETLIQKCFFKEPRDFNSQFKACNHSSNNNGIPSQSCLCDQEPVR